MIDPMTEARKIAAQCWCDPETSDRVMDPALCEAVAMRICRWMEDAAECAAGKRYYRGLLVQCGEIIGKEAYVTDDGSVSDDVLVAKVPQLVKELIERKR